MDVLDGQRAEERRPRATTTWARRTGPRRSSTSSSRRPATSREPLVRRLPRRGAEPDPAAQQGQLRAVLRGGDRLPDHPSRARHARLRGRVGGRDHRPVSRPARDHQYARVRQDLQRSSDRTSPARPTPRGCDRLVESRLAELQRALRRQRSLPGRGPRDPNNSCGHPVLQILTDYQSRANGGDGWLRYYTFKPSENKIYAYTYSPTLGTFETDATSQFTLDFAMNGAAPFEALGTVNTTVRIDGVDRMARPSDEHPVRVVRIGQRRFVDDGRSDEPIHDRYARLQ